MGEEGDAVFSLAAAGNFSVSSVKFEALRDQYVVLLRIFNTKVEFSLLYTLPAINRLHE